MPRNLDKISLAWLVRHPLVATCILFALTMLLPYTRVAERLKLIPFLPLAYAASDVPEAQTQDLPESERLQRDLHFERERAGKLAAENAALADALRDARSLATADPAFAEVVLPKAVPARVIFHGDSSLWRHCIWINRGKDSGIEERMPVVAGRTLVGRTFMVAADHACVQLITDPGFAASCVIVDALDPQKRVRGVLRGDASALPHFPRLELEDVAGGDVVSPGMRVLTSDFTGQFPAGLNVGIVREAIPQAGFLQVRLEADLDLEGLDVVQVLLHKRPELEAQAVALMKKGKG
ncbi:MAG: rod shape-determining protein MreC [Planctomycetes bacterium]|nr:rod shape-determining protein MreC [Planctomycetota bacterium]